MRRTRTIPLLLAIALQGCGDDITPSVPAGPSRLSRLDPAPASADCPAGGTAVRAGIDDDGDGVLDDAEVDETRLVCGVPVHEIWDGDVTADTWSDPTAMAALGAARIVTGDLTLEGDDVVALPRLEHVHGTVAVRRIAVPPELPRLETIGGRLDLNILTPVALPALRDIRGAMSAYASAPQPVSLPALTRVGAISVDTGPLVRFDLPALTRIDGDATLCEVSALDAGALTEVGGRARLRTPSASSLAALRTVGGELQICGDTELPALERAAGLRNTGNAAVLRLPRLTALEGAVDLLGTSLQVVELPALARTAGHVWVGDSPRLQTLDLRRLVRIGVDAFGDTAGPTARRLWLSSTGLPSLALPELVTFTVTGNDASLDIQVVNNPALRSIELPRVVTADLVFVRGNAALESVTAPNLVIARRGLDVGANPALTAVDMPVREAASVMIAGLPRSALPLLSHLRRVDWLELDACALEDLSPLSSLEAAGAVVLRNNASLASLRGMPVLDGLDRLELLNNDALVDVAGIQLPASFDGSLDLAGNDALASLTALGHLRRIAGGLYLSNLRALTGLDGLEGLTSVGELFIHRNAGLTSLAGLRGLTSVESDVRIDQNAALPAAEVDALLRRIGRTP